jgi:tripartite-type tricarboxylate transporter receptor subunit TctC
MTTFLIKVATNNVKDALDMWVPTGTPKAAVHRLHGAVKAALDDPAVKHTDSASSAK